MRNLRHFVPVESRWIANRLLEARGIVAIGDDVKPVTVAPVFGDTPLVRGEQDRTACGAEPFDLDQAQLAG